MASLDPDASLIMALMDERLADREVIQAQQEQLIGLAVLLGLQERSLHVLLGLVRDLAGIPDD